MGLTPGEIVAIGAILVSALVSLRNSSRIAQVNGKADVIVGHVNSQATADRAKIASLAEQVALLTKLLTESENRATVLAQANAQAAASMCKAGQ